MAGQDVAYHGNILHNITHFMNMDFIGFGDNRLTGEVLEYGSLEDSLYVRLVLDGKRIVGANILDNYRISGIVKKMCIRDRYWKYRWYPCRLRSGSGPQ